ncbi:MAG: DNA (cytosine-5-)-methyltransferase [Thermoanaerobaculia bacterium]|nr:DNA (cytosine-5-)-methyltransferase [Thermoanaerobaculia bacterium]
MKRPADQSVLFGPATRVAVRAGKRKPLAVVGLFAGIGGIEVGLARAGHRARLLCENEPGAIAVLHERFPDIPVHEDVCDLEAFPRGTQLVTAGFPCQDLSQAGSTAGIRGERSGLIDEVFRLLRSHDVPWLLLENVPFMLQLHRGQALDHIVTALEDLGYAWAYRVVDSRSTGLPQRRERVYIVASRAGDPRDVLLVDDAGEPSPPSPERWRDVACGFYWTEGLRGLGWAHDAVPTLKGGSTIGIPSPPAIVLPSGEIVQPDIRDAERLQGFEPDWTLPSNAVQRPGHRWKLVGNAVTVAVAAWIGRRLIEPGTYDPSSDVPLHRREKGSWPRAAWGSKGERWISSVSAWPLSEDTPSLEEFLRFPTRPLSERAAAGFYSRARQAKLRFPPGFLELVERRANGSLRA